jgi:eukaryotic-like serine/threonine-protein kinase
MKFTYSSGQRPLDGFTLKRGIGRGGFGEVYFAVSDGGKEVALKLVRGSGDSAIELRGVAHCLNLKHPNLVSLYDLRKDTEGNPWVVMEYIAGEPLNVVLARHPDGLPRELAREWFLGLARAVGHLHDHGIVHRDLKPGNVFLENGTVKVGDYGLSKSISTSQRSAQTMSVGTVHYMAPEISTGNYNKQIDTYAAGIILYEMLTGHVPFEGESAGEILMKHLTAPPDLSRLPAEYVPVVSKALAKNPAQRHAGMAEMVRAVETAEDANPPRAAATPAAAAAAPRPAVEPAARSRPSQPVLMALPAETFRTRMAELGGSMTLAVLFALLGTMLWSVAPGPQKHKGMDTLALGHLFFLTISATWAVLVPAKFWTARRGNPWARRIVMLVMGALVGVQAYWLDGGTVHVKVPFAASADFDDPAPQPDTTVGPLGDGARYLTYYGLGFFALRWWRMADRRRTSRFSFAPVLGAAFWGLLLTRIGPYADGAWGTSMMVLVMTSVVVQMVSPWEPAPAPAAKRVRLRCA